MQSSRGSVEEPSVYRIEVAGHLKEDWSDWFNGMTITPSSDLSGAPITTLVGSLADQAALQGILSKLHNLNLQILLVTLENE